MGDDDRKMADDYQRMVRALDKADFSHRLYHKPWSDSVHDLLIAFLVIAGIIVLALAIGDFIALATIANDLNRVVHH